MVDAPVSPALSMGWLPDREIYWRPTAAGNLLVGGGSAPTGAPRDAADEFRARAHDAAGAVLADPGDRRVVDDWAGVDGTTPDSYPVVDRVGSAGLAVAAGFHGWGVMTSFTAGAAVRGLPDGTAPSGLDAFALDRSRSFPFVDVSA